MTARVIMQTSLDKQTKTKRFEEKINNLRLHQYHFQEYFNVQLVSVLDGLETLHRSNTDFWKGLMEKCLKSELNVVPIIAKCHEDMMTAVGAVNSDTDAEVVVTKYVLLLICKFSHN